MIPARLHDTLTWVERLLMAVGVVLSVWSAMVMLEARFFEHLPVPHPSPAATGTLPGDAGPAGNALPAPVAPGSWVARLEAPSVHLAATVLEGSDDATLARGAGHIEDTPLPGGTGNVGIAGHRDTTFRAVRNLKIGDPLLLITMHGTQRYRVAWMKVVDPEDVYVLDPTPAPALTLVTCFPFEFIGHAPHRYIVRADLVGNGPRASDGSR